MCRRSLTYSKGDSPADLRTPAWGPPFHQEGPMLRVFHQEGLCSAYFIKRAYAPRILSGGLHTPLILSGSRRVPEFSKIMTEIFAEAAAYKPSLPAFFIYCYLVISLDSSMISTMGMAFFGPSIKKSPSAIAFLTIAMGNA